MKKTYFIKAIKLIAILLLSISCQNGTKPNKENPSELSETSTDTLHSMEEIVETTHLAPVEMLLPVQYRKNSTGYPKNAKENDWFEFYKDENSGQWKIEKSNPIISYGYDECVGDDIMIIKSKHENTVMFFTPFEGLTENPVTIMQDYSIFPEHNLKFSFQGKDYKLLPMGNCIDEEGNYIPSATVKEMSEDDLGDTRIDDYTLSFKAAGNDSYTIASIPQMIGVTPKVIWAGDMNGDGLPDLVLSLSNFYEAVHVFLFLSDKNDAQKPLKKAADLEVQNDC